MSVQIVSKQNQAYGAFNGGEIIENKPIGFSREGGELKAYSNLFYWAYAEAKVDSTIGLHPHQGFEIMSFVLRGQIRHYDTAGKTWIPLNEGDVQIIKAGNGISHAEFMAKDAVMFQIWFDPGLEKTMRQPASYNDYNLDDFPLRTVGTHQVRTLVGGDSPLTMDSSQVKIQRHAIPVGKHSLDLEEQMIHSFYLIKGGLKTNDEAVNQDDFIKVDAETKFEFETEEPLDLFHISTPAKLGYKTYAELMQSSMS